MQRLDQAARNSARLLENEARKSHLLEEEKEVASKLTQRHLSDAQKASQKISELEGQLGRLTASIQLLSNQEVRFKEEIRDMVAERESITRLNSQLMQGQKDLRQALESSTQDTQRLTSQLTELQKTLPELEQKSVELEMYKRRCQVCTAPLAFLLLLLLLHIA